MPSIKKWLNYSLASFIPFFPVITSMQAFPNSSSLHMYRNGLVAKKIFAATFLYKKNKSKWLFIKQLSQRFAYLQYSVSFFILPWSRTFVYKISSLLFGMNDNLIDFCFYTSSKSININSSQSSHAYVVDSCYIKRHYTGSKCDRQHSISCVWKPRRYHLCRYNVFHL